MEKYTKVSFSVWAVRLIYGTFYIRFHGNMPADKHGALGAVITPHIYLHSWDQRRFWNISCFFFRLFPISSWYFTNWYVIFYYIYENSFWKYQLTYWQIVFVLGSLVDFISAPVVSGFTSAAAFTIASSQVKGLLGLKYSAGTFVRTWSSFFEHVHKIRMYDSLLSIGCCITLVILKVRINRINLNHFWSHLMESVLVVGNHRFTCLPKE